MSLVAMRYAQSLRNECTIDGRSVRLMPKPTQVLELLLLTPPDRFVTKDDLVEWLWPDPDLQPLGAWNCIQVFLVRLRRAGVPVEGEWPARGCLGWRIPVEARGRVEPLRIAA